MIFWIFFIRPNKFVIEVIHEIANLIFLYICRWADESSRPRSDETGPIEEKIIRCKTIGINNC